MSLDGLPDELLIIIIKQLDLISIRNLYNAGSQRLQHVICSQGIVKKARLSLSRMATAHSLKSDFFKNISMSLLELDISAVHDLTKTKLLPAIKKMKSLVTLNVAYTNITIFDLQDIYEVCSTIRNITVNFQFHKANAEINNFPQEKLLKCQDLFSNFENVHFIGSIHNLLYSYLPSHILHKAKLNTVTYTIGQNDKIFKYYKYDKLKPFYCNKFMFKIFDWKQEIQCLFEPEFTLPDPIKYLPFDYEYVHFIDGSVYISTAFEKYFRENYKFRCIYLQPFLLQPGNRNVENSENNSDPPNMSKLYQCLMVWNKETTNFDDSFFRKLDLEIKKFEPYFVTYYEKMTPVELINDWFFINNPLQPPANKRKDVFEFKRPRISSPNVTIDYDDMLRKKKYVELTIVFTNHINCSVTLSSTSNFLKKVTFLQLRGPVRYSGEFFNILFRCCENLVTLDVESYPISPCAPPISRSVPLSQSIKNLRIVDKAIDLNTLVSSLAQSKRLENIQIVDTSNVPPNALNGADMLIRQCEYLYYLYIGGAMSETARSKLFTMLNQTKERYNRHHLFIEVLSDSQPDYWYDPFVDVFRLRRKSMWYDGYSRIPGKN